MKPLPHRVRAQTPVLGNVTTLDIAFLNVIHYRPQILLRLLCLFPLGQGAVKRIEFQPRIIAFRHCATVVIAQLKDRPRPVGRRLVDDNLIVPHAGDGKSRILKVTGIGSCTGRWPQLIGLNILVLHHIIGVIVIPDQRENAD
jgi:hypothetical protein